MKLDSFRMISFLLRCSRNIRYSRSFVLLILLSGVVSGLSNAGLLALINATLHALESSKAMFWGLIALCIILPLSRFISETLLVRLSTRALLDLRMHLCRRILSAPLPLLEQFGAHRLLATLTEDVSVISNTLTTIPLLCMHMAIVIGCLIYMAWLSKLLLMLVLAFVVIGVITYQIPLFKGMQLSRLAREEWDTLFKYLRALTEGTKELKLHRKRREAFLSQNLVSTSESLRNYNVQASAFYTASNSWGQALIFALIILILFPVFGFKSISPETLTGYALVLLYMMTPFQVILNTLPAFSRANIAMRKIEELGLSLTANLTDMEASIESEKGLCLGRLELLGVTHTYGSGEENGSFTLGPIDLTFNRGDLVFLVGSNGSGKTTFAKILTGLYVPERGEIRLDGRTITDQNRENYRQYFSTIFSDFYIFDSLLGFEGQSLDDRVSSLLIQLQLDKKVEVKDGVLSTTQLSHGQRKRLALLTAYIENRPIYVFDEWAANQDPVFKEIFYYQLLPALKANGKTIFVITHDDRYYDVADRVIKFDWGRLDYDHHLAAQRQSVSVELAQPGEVVAE